MTSIDPREALNLAEKNKGMTRREFVAVGAGATTGAMFGFNRLAQASHHESAAPITQIVKFKLKEGQEEVAVELLTTFISATEREEPGVLVYMAHRSKNDPSEVVLFEVYEDEAAYEAHRTAPHWVRISTQFMDAIVPPLDVQPLDRIGGFMR